MSIPPHVFRYLVLYLSGGSFYLKAIHYVFAHVYGHAARDPMAHARLSRGIPD